MIRIVRLQDVVDLEHGGGVNSVMVLANDGGLTAEVPVTTEQMALIVRLVQADGEAPPPAEPPPPNRGRVPDEMVQPLPPRESSVFASPEDPEAPAPVRQLDVQSILDMVQPDAGDDIPGEREGVGQL